MTRIECPTCATSYTLDRLGLQERNQHFTVACPICRVAFDGQITLVSRWLRAPEVRVEVTPRGN